jgi:hypothetical protein
MRLAIAICVLGIIVVGVMSWQSYSNRDEEYSYNQEVWEIYDRFETRESEVYGGYGDEKGQRVIIKHEGEELEVFAYEIRFALEDDEIIYATYQYVEEGTYEGIGGSTITFEEPIFANVIVYCPKSDNPDPEHSDGKIFKYQ